MTVTINATNLRTAVPGWDFDTLSLTALPDPTFDELAALEALEAFDTFEAAEAYDAVDIVEVRHSVDDRAERFETRVDVAPASTFDRLVEAAPSDPAQVADDEPLGTSYARCSDGHGTLSHLFFSDDDFDIARAKAICSKCGLREECLTGALERGEAAGVWGGQLIEDGVIIVIKRRRGRPPKVARPALVVDEVPVPPHLVA